MARFYIRAATARGMDTDRVRFVVLRAPREGRDTKARDVHLLAVIGPDDNGEPVITIGFSDDF